MKSHYCHEEQAIIEFSGQCNWCGEKEMNNEPVVWTACLDCGKRVTGDSIHTCSPQLKTLTDEEIAELSDKILRYQIYDNKESGVFDFARAILRKAQEK